MGPRLNVNDDFIFRIPLFIELRFVFIYKFFYVIVIVTIEVSIFQTAFHTGLKQSINAIGEVISVMRARKNFYILLKQIYIFNLYLLGNIMNFLSGLTGSFNFCLPKKSTAENNLDNQLTLHAIPQNFFRLLLPIFL